MASVPIRIALQGAAISAEAQAPAVSCQRHYASARQ
jgi:hypothetical protein